MYLEYVEKLDKDSFYDAELYRELMDIEDELQRTNLSMKLKEVAKKSGVPIKDFDAQYRAAQKSFQKAKKDELMAYSEKAGEMITDFSLLDTNEQLRCGDWVADDFGVRVHTDKALLYACPHPIFPTRILRNVETGKYKIEIVFKVRGKVRRVLVNREIISTPTKILKLADDSVQVTSITAPLLVKYLADLEAMNPEIITEYSSTSRLGWIEDTDENGEKVKCFLPYQKDIIFDNELNIKSLFESITEHGSREKWYKHIKEIRARKQTEFLINFAASFASVLVDPCVALPFIVCLWGGTGLGKTVTLKTCVSVWADPSEGKYIADAKGTITAMEMRLNTLNSLPLAMDDMAQIQHQYDGDFSELIYRWCAGKGKDRSNKELGLNKLTSWRNCILTNGERPLVDESTQGGAVNRVIEIDGSGKHLFDAKEGGRTTKIVESNYGFAGREFIELIGRLGADELSKIKERYYEEIKKCAEQQGVEKEDKQILPMAIILTADELMEMYLFQDGIRIDIPYAIRFLKDKGFVSEEKRAYEYLMGVVAANKFHFYDDDEIDDKHTERWGRDYGKNTIAILGNVFDAIMKKGGFQGKAFLSWARNNNLIEVAKDSNKKLVKFCDEPVRSVVIRTDYFSAENDGFEGFDELVELAKDLPFK